MAVADFGAKRWNKIEDDILQELLEFEKRVESFLLADGYPYGFTQADEQTEYENLVRMKLLNDPGYWEDPQAVQRLAELSQRFGPAPDPQFESIVS